MTKKQTRMAYERMDCTAKIERLEFWAKNYLSWLGVEGGMDALMQDVVEYYEPAKADQEDL